MADTNSQELKKIITTVAVVATLATSGAIGLNSDAGKKAIDCLGKPVKLEHGKNYYCASVEDDAKDYEDFKTRLNGNKLENTADLGFGQIIVHNSMQRMDEVATIIAAKYDTQNKIWDGSQFDGDIMKQMFLAVEIAGIKCGGPCRLDLVDPTTNERIYNLLTNE